METTTDTPRRRSRMRRTSSGKRLELTPRDIEIFKLLQRYRYLRSSFLYAFVGGKNETRFKERLGALYHDGKYLSRPAEQWQFAGARCAPAVYELDRAGEAVLANLGFSKRGHASGGEGRRQFAHTLMIAETLASIELGACQAASARVITADEIIAAAPHTSEARSSLALPVSVSHAFPRGRTETATFDLVPDAVFGLAYNEPSGGKSYRFFALECERENRVMAST